MVKFIKVIRYRCNTTENVLHISDRIFDKNVFIIIVAKLEAYIQTKKLVVKKFPLTNRHKIGSCKMFNMDIKKKKKKRSHYLSVSLLVIGDRWFLMMFDNYCVFDRQDKSFKYKKKIVSPPISPHIAVFE